MECIDRVNAGSNTVTALQKNVFYDTLTYRIVCMEIGCAVWIPVCKNVCNHGIPGAASGRNQIRNSNIEIRNNFK